MGSKQQIYRMLNYRNLLRQLKSMGFKKLFSDNISDPLDISSSLVRKDFSEFGISGNKKGGYEVDYILERIDEALGKNKIEKVIVVGVGRIGEALIKYQGFIKEGIEITAGFDSDTHNIKEDIVVPVYEIGKLEEYVNKNEIKFAIMSVPTFAAKHIFKSLTKAGIKGILNFTPVKFQSSDGVKVTNVHIVNELENLIYITNKEVNIAFNDVDNHFGKTIV